MRNPADSIEEAEQAVASARAMAHEHYAALQTKVREQASLPKVMGGVLAGAIAVGYLIKGGRSKQRVYVTEKKSGIWSTMLTLTRTLVPLLGSLYAARQAESATKTVAKATGTAPVPHDAEVHVPGQRST